MMGKAGGEEIWIFEAINPWIKCLLFAYVFDLIGSQRMANKRRIRNAAGSKSW